MEDGIFIPGRLPITDGLNIRSFSITKLVKEGRDVVEELWSRVGRRGMESRAAGESRPRDGFEGPGMASRTAG